MSRPIHLLIPMSGRGSRYRKAGYLDPKPLIPVSGTPMIERLLANFPSHWPCTFVLNEAHKATALASVLSRLRPGSTIVYVDSERPSASGLIGPACAAEAGAAHLPKDVPVLVSYCDYGMIWDGAQFERFVSESACDACVISYRGFHAHYLSPQMYAYSRLSGELVREVKEKGCFTNDRETEYASCGAYYFRSSGLLTKALQYQGRHDLVTNGEHYVSLTVEALLRDAPASHVRVFEIPGFFQWGTPEDLRTFEYWERTFRSWNRAQAAVTPATRGQVAQVLMPMAGLGSRFDASSTLPKPLIDVGGRPMFVSALSSLPVATTTSLVSLKAHQPALEEALKAASGQSNPTRVTWLERTPPGQALSTEAGLGELREGEDVIVSACDHEIVLPEGRWQEFRKSPDCDAAIFTVQGFPGARRRPEAFAYVLPKAGDESPFPEVADVVVKKPVSGSPERDHLLVGTFWFASAALLAKGIAELKRRGQTVNGELYLDSVFAVLKAMGHRVRLIPLDGYVNRGDPDSLAESLYYQELFSGRRLDLRQRLPRPGGKAHA